MMRNLIERRKTAFVPDRGYTSFGALPSVPVTMPAAPWEEATKVVHDHPPRNAGGRSYMIEIFGVKFASLTQAALALHIDKRTLIDAHRARRVDVLIDNLLQREATGRRKHQTITTLAQRYAALQAMVG